MKAVNKMKITYTGRKMAVPDDLKALVDKKLAKFDKFFPNGADTAVVFSKLRDHECLEITISYGGTLFRAESRNDTFQNALDDCVSVIDRQIRKNKTKIEKRYRNTPYRFTPGDVAEAADDTPVVRVKTFSVKPLTTEEAILQMDLLGHDFFVFRDLETEETCVVYKRHDDTYGLIVPE